MDKKTGQERKEGRQKKKNTKTIAIFCGLKLLIICHLTTINQSPPKTKFKTQIENLHVLKEVNILEISFYKN